MNRAEKAAAVAAPVPAAEQLAPPAEETVTTDGMIQVYVSSVAHPLAFWVQVTEIM